MSTPPEEATELYSAAHLPTPSKRSIRSTASNHFHLTIQPSDLPYEFIPPTCPNLIAPLPFRIVWAFMHIFVYFLPFRTFDKNQNKNKTHRKAA